MYSPTEMQLTRPATVNAPILCVGGARPNFVKIVPLIRAMRRAIPPLHVSLCILGSITPIVDAERPAAVLVVGDVNSTIACALVVAKKGVAVIHVEARLRSFDRTMPEEINRVLTDQISDLLFTTEKSARDNLSRETIALTPRIFVRGEHASLSGGRVHSVPHRSLSAASTQQYCR